MKKNFCAIIAMTLLTITSCKKTDTSTTGAGGSWTVNSTSYQAVTCTGSVPSLYLSAANVGAQGSLTASDIIVQFYNQFPPAAGTYNVVTNDSALTAPNQVQIVTTINGINGTSYASNGSGSNQTAVVTVSGGKVSVVGSGINVDNSASTATVSLNLHQLQ